MLWLAIAFVRLPLEVVTDKTETSAVTAVIERQKVLLASEEAQAHGITSGQKVASAQALHEGLNIFERQPSKETRRLQHLAESLLFVTPDISLNPPYTLVLNIQGSLKMFQGNVRLLGAIQKSLHGTGHHYHAGLGHTPLAAEILTSHYSDLRTLAHRFPDTEAFHHALDQVPISTLPLPEALLDALQAPGFRYLSELGALPDGALGKRHGKQLLDWLEKLRGKKPDPRQPVQSPDNFHAEVTFNEPVENCAQLLFPARRLLSEMNFFLRQRHLCTRAIRWQLYGHHQKQAITIRRASTHQDLSLWIELTRRKFEQTSLHDGVLKLSLNCARPTRTRIQTDSLFSDPSARPSPEALLEKLSTLPELVLSGLNERDEFLPENMQGLSCPLQSSRQEKETSIPDDQDFPLWLLDTPRPLRLQHRALLWRGASLVLLPGERRLSLNWWQQSVRRRYFVAQHPKGLSCWVFLDEIDKRWYLHGFF